MRTSLVLLLGLAVTPALGVPGESWILPIDRLDGTGWTELPGAGYAGTSAWQASGADGVRRVYWRLGGIGSLGHRPPASTQLYTIEFFAPTAGDRDWQPIESQFRGVDGELFPLEPLIPWAGAYGTNHQWIGSDGRNDGAWHTTGPGPQTPNSSDFTASSNGTYMWLRGGEWHEQSLLYAKWDFGWDINRAWSALRLTQVTGEPDADEDGVPDSSDLCPSTPLEEPADENGCSCSQRDSDGDGFNDCIDNCPDTPNPGQADSDEDGLGDACDPVLISGIVQDLQGNPVPGVLMSTGDGTVTSTAGSDGRYALMVPVGWSGTIAPSRQGWNFLPTLRTYPPLTVDLAAQDYTARLLRTIGGAVYQSVADPIGSGLAGVTITVEEVGGTMTAVTDNLGLWSLAVPEGTWTLTPHLGGHWFQYAIAGVPQGQRTASIQVDAAHQQQNESLQFLADTCVRADMNWGGYPSIVSDVQPFVNVVYFGQIAWYSQQFPGLDPYCPGDMNGDGLLTIVGDVPEFVDCVYFNNCSAPSAPLQISPVQDPSGFLTVGGAVYSNVSSPLTCGVAGVTVTLSGDPGTFTAVSVGGQGLWSASIPEGTYTLTASANGACPQPVVQGTPQPGDLQITADAAHRADIQNLQFLSAAPMAPDLDLDCDVDGYDLALFVGCAAGPRVPHDGSPTCTVADLDADGDVDLDDFGAFQRCYGGSHRPPAPGCWR